MEHPRRSRLRHIPRLRARALGRLALVLLAPAALTGTLAQAAPPDHARAPKAEKEAAKAVAPQVPRVPGAPEDYFKAAKADKPTKAEKPNAAEPPPSLPPPVEEPVAEVSSYAPSSAPAPVSPPQAPTTTTDGPQAPATQRAQARGSLERPGAHVPPGAPAAPVESLVRPAEPLLRSFVRAADEAAPASSEPTTPKRRSAAREGAAESTGGARPLPVIGPIRELVERVPESVKALLGALAGLSAALGGGYLVVAARARRLDRQRTDLLQDVGLLQTALLPAVPAIVGGLRTSVAYRPSDGPGAGGDFYDALTLPGGRAAFILGDVSGHGRQALARTAFMRYTLRAYLEAGLEPRSALQVAGRAIGEDLDGHFATVVLMVHDPVNGSLTYACAGHPAPIVVGPSRPEPVLAVSSPPIGLGIRTGLRQTTLPFPPGSVACLYTDGLAEARTAGGILGRPRLADIVEELGRDATAAGVLDAVAAEARLVSDDMATVILTPMAAVTAGGFRSERLEVNAEEAEGGLTERFLSACDIPADRLDEAAAEARALAVAYGGAVVYVRFGMMGPQVEVLPHNVVSLEAASQLRAVPRRSSA